MIALKVFEHEVVVHNNMVLSTLSRRGLLAATTIKEGTKLKSCSNFQRTALQAVVKKDAQPVSVYLGFDPTASSLHVGHLLGIITLRRFQKAGFRPIALIGGATGLVGDPSFRSNERPILSKEELDKNVAGIEEDLRKLLDFDDGMDTGAKLVNNYDWFGNMNLLDFFRTVGYHFRVGKMLARDSVKPRLDAEGGGLSYTEFSYQLLQGYDFLHLYENYNCQIQLGGSDQWGNILSGTELVRKSIGAEVHGVTFPLLTTSSGEKFGKSSGNAVWLSSKKTSSYEFYQFFLRTEDSDVEQLLYKLTEVDEDTLKELLEKHGEARHERKAQKFLAETMTRMLHGEDGLEKALNASHILFGGDLDFVSSKQLLQLGNEGIIPMVRAPKSDHLNDSICHIAAKLKVCKSVGEARRLVKNGGLYVNNVRVDTPNETLESLNCLMDGRVLLLRTGRKQYTLLDFSNSLAEQ